MKKTAKLIPGSLSTRELAERWEMHPNTLGLWRRTGRGPAYIKKGLNIFYTKEAVEEFEMSLLLSEVDPKLK